MVEDYFPLCYFVGLSQSHIVSSSRLPIPSPRLIHPSYIPRKWAEDKHTCLLSLSLQQYITLSTKGMNDLLLIPPQHPHDWSHPPESSVGTWHNISSITVCSTPQPCPIYFLPPSTPPPHILQLLLSSTNPPHTITYWRKPTWTLPLNSLNFIYCHYSPTPMIFALSSSPSSVTTSSDWHHPYLGLYPYCRCTCHICIFTTCPPNRNRCHNQYHPPHWRSSSPLKTSVYHLAWCFWDVVTCVSTGMKAGIIIFCSICHYKVGKTDVIVARHKI